MTEYNPIFERIVGDQDNNPERLLAYALYKREKYNWTAARKAEGKPPTDADKSVFVESCVHRIDSYLAEAGRALDGYAQAVVASERPAIEKNAITGRVEQAAQKLESWPSVWKQIGTGIASWVASLVLLLIAAWGAKTLGIDVIEALK